MSPTIIGIVIGAIAIYLLWPKQKCNGTSKREKKKISERDVSIPPVSSKVTHSQHHKKENKPTQPIRPFLVSKSTLLQTESVSLIPKVIPTPSPEKLKPISAESSLIDNNRESSDTDLSDYLASSRNAEISKINYESDMPTARELTFDSTTNENSFAKTAKRLEETPKKRKIPTLSQVSVSPLHPTQKVTSELESTRTAIQLEDKENKPVKSRLSDTSKKTETTKNSSQTVEKQTAPSQIIKPNMTKEEPKKSNAANPATVLAPAAASSSQVKSSQNEVKKSTETDKSRKDKKDKSNRQDKKKSDRENSSKHTDKKEKKSKKEKSSTSSDRKKDKKDKKGSSKQPKSGDGV